MGDDAPETTKTDERSWLVKNAFPIVLSALLAVCAFVIQDLQSQVKDKADKDYVTMQTQMILNAIKDVKKGQEELKKDIKEDQQEMKEDIEQMKEDTKRTRWNTNAIRRNTAPPDTTR